MRNVLTEAWLKRGLLACVLWPISACFGCLVRIRQWLYRLGVFKSHHLPVPVLVVGNVLVGGVGKTPVVMALVEHLRQRGLHVGVLSRGYGRTTRDQREVHANSQAQDAGDEPLLIARRCGVPVWVGADRAAAGEALLHKYPNTQVLVCDDGLQHLALARDIEVCVFDERDVGNGWLLPAGPLREPWPRAAALDVNRFELTRAATPSSPRYQVRKQLAHFAVRADGTQRSLQDWRTTPVQAIAGIAKPQVFFDMLAAQGLSLTNTQALADHADMRDLVINARLGDVLCTEKDAVKLWHLYPTVWAVPLLTTLPPAFLQAIDALLDSKLSSHHGLQTT